MYKDFKELKVGSVFYQWRTYTGLVKFEVTGRKGDKLLVKSISTSGYNFELDKKVFNSFHGLDKKRYFYKKYEGAIDDKNKRDAARQKEYVDQFKNDKEAFFVELLKKSYHKEMDGEYGDCVEAMAIKELAEHYYPEMNIHE